MSKRPELNGFSEACYDQTSIEELISALEDTSSDKTDCKAWNITPRKWREAIAAALLARIIDRYRLPTDD